MNARFSEGAVSETAEKLDLTSDRLSQRVKPEAVLNTLLHE